MWTFGSLSFSFFTCISLMKQGKGPTVFPPLCPRAYSLSLHPLLLPGKQSSFKLSKLLHFLQTQGLCTCYPGSRTVFPPLWQCDISSFCRVQCRSLSQGHPSDLVPAPGSPALFFLFHYFFTNKELFSLCKPFIFVNNCLVH